jgi:catechol 2,3-dioxygenase
METSKISRRVINPGTSIGHIHLKVANIERALGFYRDILGFEVTQWYGDDAVFLSAGGYHHHIGLNTWMSRNADPAPPHSAGLFHLAILYPERRDLALALKWLLESKYPIDGTSDHGVSEALYLQDPDGNGVELYRDRPREEWPRTPEGGLAMVTRPLDAEGLLAELDHEETS